jgi:starch synthase (maltosyl-transferring)
VVNETRGWRSGPRIYQLFPLLAGPMTRWAPHLERARRLGFDWVFVNAVQLSGYSGSLYSIKDHLALDPRVVDPDGPAPHEQLRAVVDEAGRLGLSLMTDLVMNHTAFDSPLVDQHPTWYKLDADGQPERPRAKDGEDWVVWGDLAEIDNAESPDRDALWSYWLSVAERYAKVGFLAFRCDAAYKVPAELWRFLIPRVKASHPDTLFFAESLGCEIEDTIELARAGFDFVFNSSKWWDFEEPWCLTQYHESAPLAASVSFPETHDTERLAAELDGDVAAVKMRYAFAALFSTAVMMPIGFEYGFRRKLDVVKTRPEDWETPRWDLSEFIASVNRLKASHRVFNEDGPIDPLDAGNPSLFAFVKSSLDGRERAVVLLNKDREESQTCELSWLGDLAPAAALEDVSPEEPLDRTPDWTQCRLGPSAFHVLLLPADTGS